MKKNVVDLILLDMVMPKRINGRETYEQIIKIRPGQKAVIASGFSKTREVDTAQELGVGKIGNLWSLTPLMDSLYCPNLN